MEYPNTAYFLKMLATGNKRRKLSLNKAFIHRKNFTFFTLNQKNHFEIIIIRFERGTAIGLLILVTQ